MRPTPTGAAGLALGALLSLGSGPAVQVGLERIDAERGGLLRGRRVGLVVHAASVTADGRHAVGVLQACGVRVVRLFAPEHGLRSRAAAGEPVPDQVDAQTGLPVMSLYGGKPKPSPEDLAGLDALVFDLQDAGVRFYSYTATLLLCLEAASQAGIELVVLDRPNPMGGERLEGPEAEAGETAQLSSLPRAPGPLVHGLTSGELARYANLRLSRPGRLTVVPMKGWRRSMIWAETGRAWVPPSPNLRSAEAALAYPGTCLLEATNVSEGRGAEAPFLVFGAPWLRGEELRRAVSVPGFALEPARFTPRASEAAPDPKYRDQECAGLRVRVTDGGAARPYELGLALLAALRRGNPEFRWRDEGAALDRLLGTRRVREALERGDSARAVVAADAVAIEAFRRNRRAALLY